jgi:CO/xanthine dehydrogenase FAD-binding subunit
LSEVEQLLDGQTLDEGLGARAAELAVASARAVVSERGTSNATKIPLVAALVSRALLSLSGSEQLSPG